MSSKKNIPLEQCGSKDAESLPITALSPRVLHKSRLTVRGILFSLSWNFLKSLGSTLVLKWQDKTQRIRRTVEGGSQQREKPRARE